MPYRIPATLRLTVVGLITVTLAPAAFAEDTWMYTVQISATVQTSPASITLRWQPDYHGVTNHMVYRKAKTATSWGFLTSLPGSATNYVDSNVAVGDAYEYQIVKRASPGYRGYGYIFAGIQAPLTEGRGKVILIVANTHANSLATELARLESDLVGDGWTVLRHDVATNSTPASIRTLIINDYNSDPGNVNTVFLFGAIPVFHSGNLDYDDHLARPMPADAYYGDVVGTWTTNLNFLPADVRLMVGRVDLSNMPGEFAPSPWPSEVELLRNYLNKDHAWRHRLIQVPRRALMGNRRGDELGEATAATGYRNFEPFVGPGNTIEANIADVSPPHVRWGPMLSAESYLWAYGCGGGMPTGISHLGTSGEYNSLYSEDIVGQDAKGVFVMLFGSWFANWDGKDNFLRAFLATPTLGLTSCMAGRPHWFLHHMGLGETIGYATRLSMNNNTLYQNQSNGLPRAIYTALMGDPTLRMDIVAPPSALWAMAGSGTVNLNWGTSAESVLGYHVYRRNTPGGTFSRLTGSLVAGTTYSDPNGSMTDTYMVRAVKLQVTPSGTYFNASQGTFANVTLPIRVSTKLSTNALTLRWNSLPGTTYRVFAAQGLNQNWSNISGNIVATETNTSWTETNIKPYPQRLYRVVTP